MANLKAGIMGAVGTIVVVIIELLLFPIMFSFMSGLNTTGTCNASGQSCSGEWIAASDQTILQKVPTLSIVMVLFTVLGGMVASVYLATKG